MSAIIDLKFKDMPPEETVNKIQKILTSLGIEVEETWYDSGVDHCHSLSVTHKGGYASSNGKGITKELARASAYAEFIERLQQGLHYYKLQSQAGIPGLDLHTYAPDGKYMTVQELIDNSDWMDILIATYGKTITRKQLAKLCKDYACTEDDKILTLPYYSLFEDKYVYIPAAFATQMYTTNGCCAGNTPEEAIVHGISELYERNCNDKLLLSGSYAPKISDSILDQFPTVSKILNQLRKNDNFDVTVFDVSNGTNFPAVVTRIIDKKNQEYIVNGAADPILEIAVQRTLTETFQGRQIENIHTGNDGLILNKMSDIPFSSNLRNMREVSVGTYAADFFCEPEDHYTSFQYPDNRNKNNKELLKYVLDLCKTQNRQIYIRNYSYLGFPSYKIIIPGFSEGFWPHLSDPASEYALGNEVSKFFRDISSAKKPDLILLMLYSQKVSNYLGVANNFTRLSGIPISDPMSFYLAKVTFAHTFYMLGKLSDALSCTESIVNCDFICNETRKYFRCLSLYLKLKIQNLSDAKLRTIIVKFNKAQYAEALFDLLDANKSPFENYLIKCDFKNCENCRYKEYCSYEVESNIINIVGPIYRKFADGQNKENFPTT